MTMPDEESREPVKNAQQDTVDMRVRAAMAACIAMEMRTGKSREEATQICYARLRKQLDARSPSP